MCSGSLIGHPVENIRIVLTDGASHAVDSSELAFKMAAIYAFRKVFLSSCQTGNLSFYLLLFLFYSSLHHDHLIFIVFILQYSSMKQQNLLYWSP